MRPKIKKTYIVEIDGFEPREFEDYAEARDYELSLWQKKAGVECFGLNFQPLSIADYDGVYYIHVIDVENARLTINAVYDAYGFYSGLEDNYITAPGWFEYDTENDEWINLTERLEHDKMLIDALGIEI